ncbi:MAG: hypothetical protein PW844_13880 [Pantoea sp.]|uniref:hypothetical protein n=1 Tax=Pantoea sp. TaxID=69393 RepID=UPI00239C0766|nr:hypothetical protein [Pantoea sp.]MDE1187547.1 hypothetical protein [Pantoea sp.]
MDVIRDIFLPTYQFITDGVSRGLSSLVNALHFVRNNPEALPVANQPDEEGPSLLAQLNVEVPPTLKIQLIQAEIAVHSYLFQVPELMREENYPDIDLFLAVVIIQYESLKNLLNDINTLPDTPENQDAYAERAREIMANLFAQNEGFIQFLAANEGIDDAGEDRRRHVLAREIVWSLRFIANSV